MRGYRYIGEENIGIIAVLSTVSIVPETKVFIIVRLNLINYYLLVLGNMLIIRRGRYKFKSRFIDGEAFYVGDKAINILLPG